MHSLAQEIKKKDTALAYVWKMLSNIEISLTDATKALDSSYKTVNKLKASLNDAREGLNILIYPTSM